MTSIDFNQQLIHTAEKLKPFALSLTRESESAKDLFQETMYRALSNREKYSAGTNIKAWMFTIMRNIFINDYRRNARYNTVFDSTAKEFLIDYNQTHVANNAGSDLQLKVVKEAIFSLPGIFKVPFEMYLEGYSYNEISLILQEPLGTVKSRIHFARKLLKESITRH